MEITEKDIQSAAKTAKGGITLAIKLLIIWSTSVTTAVVYLAIKNNNLYASLTEVEKNCSDKLVEALENERERTYQATKLADSLHRADQEELRRLYYERILIAKKQTDQINKLLKK